MKFSELDLRGVWLIEPTLVEDSRGVFRRHFCAHEFAEHSIATSVAQGNVSENPVCHTVRGFHYQVGGFAEAKTISRLSGALYDIVVDLRRDSPTFMKWIAVELSARNRHSLHVPAGCANAWMTTEPNTLVHYYMSEPYAPNCYRGFRYNDPAFGFRWPAAPASISEKDSAFSDFDPLKFDSV